MRYSWYVNKDYMRDCLEHYRVLYHAAVHGPNRIKFNMIKYPNLMEKKYMSSELEDLEKIYRDQITELDQAIQVRMPNYLNIMENFVKMHRERDEIKYKLQNLLEKMGKSESDGEEDEDGGDNG